MKKIILFGLPLLFDVIVSLVLFVGRHSLASQGYGEKTVGSIVMFYGIGYVIASLLMARIVKPQRAKQQLLGALTGVIVICIALANVQRLIIIQILYGLFPLAASLLFNAFQIYMLGISNQDTRPLAETAGHFTFAWSIGFALGPFASSALKSLFPWSQIYYLAALLAALAGIVLYGFKPHKSDTTRAETPSAPHSHGQSLVESAWLGLVIGLIVWNAVLVYWPVQAVQMGIADNQRGWTEFAFAMMQGLAALLLTYVHRWHYKPIWLLMMGGSGVVALSVFGLSTHAWLFVVGAVLYGAYCGTLFSFMVYHAMVEEDKAVRRVALNETFVGIAYLSASPVASLLHKDGAPFGPSYLFLGLILIIGVLGQTLFAYNLMKRDASQPVEVRESL
jgi:MFS family permease